MQLRIEEHISNGKHLFFVASGKGSTYKAHGVATNAKDVGAWDDFTFYAFKYDENGNQLWEYKYGTSYTHTEPYAALVDAHDNIFLIGFASKNHDNDFYVIKS